MGDSSNDEEVSDLRDWAATDFWLGKKYFEFTLLRVIVKDHSVCDPKTLEVRISLLWGIRHLLCAVSPVRQRASLSF
jgi:hypothetical protein